jgi:FemAB-related protein (PEP-CTERM system-associated)
MPTAAPDLLAEPVHTVRAMQDVDMNRWDEFVRSNACGTFFHLSAWKSLIEAELGHKAHYLLCEANGLIEGVLPIVHIKSRLFGNSLISIPFLVYGGAVTSSAVALDELLAAAKSLADELGVDYLELRNREPLPGDWHTKSTYVTFRKKLDPDPEENLKAIPRKQRAMIRKGINAGLIAEEDQDVKRLYRAMLECKRNLGTPFFGESWLRAIKQAFKDDAEIITVVKDERTVCSVMSFRYGDEVLPYYGGGGVLARDLKGNDFMYWEVMKRACVNGIQVFDYGRSTVNTGAYRFKKHWGFEPQPLHYQYHFVKCREVPNLNPSNPRYEFLIRRWRQLPLAVAGVLGPRIAARLG